MLNLKLEFLVVFGTDAMHKFSGSQEVHEVRILAAAGVCVILVMVIENWEVETNKKVL